jgi:phosphoribosylformylglycinamidine cyclo-ligase
LVRRVVSAADLAWSDAAPFAPGRSLGEALLEPTRLYVRPLLAALREGPGIRALAHITGGGFPDNIPRVLPNDTAAEINLDMVPVLPVFRWLAAIGGIAEFEMLRTFNCGIGMIVVVDPAEAAAVESRLVASGLAPVCLGRLVRRDAGAPVRFSGRLAL